MSEPGTGLLASGVEMYPFVTDNSVGPLIKFRTPQFT